MTKGTPKYVCFTLTTTYVLIHLNSWKYQRFFVSIKSKHIRSHKSINAPLIKQRKIDQNLWITFQNWPSIHFSLCYNNLFIVWTGWLQTSFQIKMKKQQQICVNTLTRAHKCRMKFTVIQMLVDFLWPPIMDFDVRLWNR